MSNTVLQMKHISKAFSGVSALKSANLTLEKGQVMALVGENGAGKSTLMRILAGIYDYDNGEIKFNNKPVRFRNAMQSRNAGIAIIHQEFNLFSNLTAAENIFLGSEQIKHNGLISWDKMNNRAQELVDSIGGTFSVTEKVQDLTVQNQQVVEIIKAIAANAEILIMDEPTSALPENEVHNLFATIRGLQARGVAIIYVSHRLNEIFEICEAVTVLRDGVTAFRADITKTSQNEVVAQMIGKEVNALYPEKSAHKGEVVFEVRGLNDADTVKDLSFCVRKGEILGLYGLVGSGATECPQALFGLVEKQTGAFFVNGLKVKIKKPIDAIKHGIAYVPADRHREGIIRPLSIQFNLSLTVVKKLCRAMFVNKTKEKLLVAEYLEKLHIKCAGHSQACGALSGGNQQKVVIAKWLATQPSLLILNDPTRGVDVGAKAEIYSLISALAGKGLAIIITSSELSEILGMSDRILVLNKGYISQSFTREEANQRALLSAAVTQQDTKKGDV